MVPIPHFRGSPLQIALLGGLLVMAGPVCANAQSMSANSASFNAGYGRVAGQENRAVEVTTRDANGNRVVVDGLILTGADQSVFARAGGGGAIDAFSGVGANGGSTAIGNNLVVVTQGSNNTVIVSSQQTNTGSVTATTTLDGGH
jgi:holdfast attachment protein HfaA